MNGSVQALTKRLSGLSPERRALLQRLMRQQQPMNEQVEPRDRSLDPPPVTFAQEQLWFLDQLSPGNWFYNESSAIQLKFAVDAVVLQQALNEIARRHATLRTTFAMVRGELVQIIADQFVVPLNEIDLTAFSELERTAEARRIANQDAQTPFDLSADPLIRTTLLRTSPEEAIFLLTMHHIIFDGWSFTVLLGELSELFDAFAAGVPSPLPELSIQYADFAVWQRRWLRSNAFGTKLAYWRKQLADLPTLAIPTDHPRPAVQGFQGARYKVKISRNIHDAVRALSIVESVTPFMVLLTAFKALLYRYTDQTDIVVGVPMAGRDREETTGLIGLFVNTLVMRTDLSGNPTFTEALERVRQVSLDAFAHQDVPFEKLVQELQPKRDLSRNPLFQVTFQIYGSGTSIVPEEGGSLLDGATAPFEIEASTAKFDLRFDLAEQNGSLQGFLEYDTALFETATIVRMADHFLRLLEHAVYYPETRFSELPLLSEDERVDLLATRNATATPYPRQARIEALFAQQVARSPEAIALEFEGETLSYAELETRANRVAHYLRSLGVSSEARVGLSGERSIEMIVGMLGILKAGAVYVPFDVEEPTERLLLTLQDAEVRVVLTRELQLSSLAQRGLRIVALGLETAEINRQPSDPPAGVGEATSLAYIMFTSGSTGVPKGVCVPHRAVVRLVSTTDYFRAEKSDVFLQFAPLAFDASTFEIWGALLNGARLVLFPAHVPSMDELAQTIMRTRTSIMWLTAPLFHHLVDLHLDCFSGVRQLLAGGDVLSAAHAKKFIERHPNSTLTNGYGPTENTTFTCTQAISAGVALGSSVPIGKPVANTKVYVLDHYLNPVPFGIVGQLFAAGDGLAEGYLNRPELTAQKFLRNPFDAAPEARMYATGDYVRYRLDGSLEFLGRIDHQVKIRGFRVELDEIESVLRTHSALRDAACSIWKDNAGDKRIVAYVLVKEGDRAHAPSTSELRRFLEERLPDYFIPSAVIMLNAFPLTANGKVDRAALPTPSDTRPQLDHPFVPPQTETERTVAAVWQEVLGIQNAGIHDNFFDLGGHSLLIVLLHNRLKELFPKQLTIVDLFRHPTVASLSRVLNEPETPAPV